ncbi:hypothetical protein ACGFIV_00850 [Sphaerisporangium sp. NPDC049003]|uniref:hypothetical protein n=1 Tax=Sphaerisporangium sp. NPDC049003 TaxID=3364517 RepID=UPI0037166943
MAETHDHGAVWIQSDLLPGGTYVATLHADDDNSRVLDRDTALRYAAAVHQAATQAEHDAAVVAQLRASGLSREEAALTLVDLRADRAPLDPQVTAPLVFKPCVSANRGVGYLELSVGDRPLGQWDADAAHAHAGHVMAVVAAVDLDAAYRRFLIGTVGLDATHAEDIVGDLAEHIQAAQ